MATGGADGGGADTAGGGLERDVIASGLAPQAQSVAHPKTIALVMTLVRMGLPTSSMMRAFGAARLSP